MRRQIAIDHLIAHDALHVFASLSEWNGLDKFVDAVEGRARPPVHHAIVARVVGGKRVLRLVVKLVQGLPQIFGSELDVDHRI